MVGVRAAPDWCGLVRQYLRFGSVGIAASLVHVLTFTAVIEMFGTSALRANLFGFMLAILVSFAGHRWWTFAGGTRREWSAFWRFTLLAGAGLGANSAIAFGVSDLLGFHYLYALGLMVSITPIALFLMSRTWVFAAGG